MPAPQPPRSGARTGRVAAARDATEDHGWQRRQAVSRLSYPPRVPIDTADIDLGSRSGPVVSFVDPDEVVAFALAINDDNPRYLDGSAVPPTYVVTPSLPV